ncbi:DUF6918 family protein [Vulgatibacter incomptus]|uniref:Uncharacterized protein n=1 Tax=Vulgatibacter incomptus TaxID=1391653 RepID=A0A0K1PGT1_9BACT|nr:hypothetical protein [Vulgatibacter incomptus]AKU92329.1 hypothetical protein AKJ08_2716 [Vulgatibacter incomptus]
MGRLLDALLSPGKKDEVIRDAARLIDEEVDAKGGLGGLALKGAYKLVTTAKQNFVGNTLERLLPDFASRLEPLYEERQRTATNEPMERFFTVRAGDVADALLAITDERAARTDRGAARSAYEKLRPAARRHVAEAAPKLGRLLDRHL